MTNYVIGIDLGQLSDRTALSVVERQSSKNNATDFICRHLMVWHPGTSVIQIAKDVKSLIGRSEEFRSSCTVALDITMAGEGAETVFRDETFYPTGIGWTTYRITGGTQARSEKNCRFVPKLELASMLRALLETKRLKIAEREYAGDLRSELSNFQVKKVMGDDTIDWRTREHDDLVLATAIACWELRDVRPLLLWGDDE